jgi:hypothetical protein
LKKKKNYNLGFYLFLNNLLFLFKDIFIIVKHVKIVWFGSDSSRLNDSLRSICNYFLVNKNKLKKNKNFIKKNRKNFLPNPPEHTFYVVMWTGSAVEIA